jgi:hypothetical protein
MHRETSRRFQPESAPNAKVLGRGSANIVRGHSSFPTKVLGVSEFPSAPPSPRFRPMGSGSRLLRFDEGRVTRRDMPAGAQCKDDCAPAPRAGAGTDGGCTEASECTMLSAFLGGGTRTTGE